MRDRDIDAVVRILKREIRQWKVPIVGVVAEKTRDPFQILISCVLSLRTQDATTAAASDRLFGVANTPAGLAALPLERVEQLIYPVGFYRVKARNIREISKQLIRQYDGRVPDEIDTLLKLPGVGRKTANLVVTIGYDKYGICVDTHVHRITNRWGYVRTSTPEKTEFALRKKLPRKHWKIINDLLVTYGQNLCLPVRPRCSECKLSPYCERVGVETDHRARSRAKASAPRGNRQVGPEVTNE